MIARSDGPVNQAKINAQCVNLEVHQTLKVHLVTRVNWDDMVPQTQNASTVELVLIKTQEDKLNVKNVPSTLLVLN